MQGVVPSHWRAIPEALGQAGVRREEAGGKGEEAGGTGKEAESRR